MAPLTFHRPLLASALLVALAIAAGCDGGGSDNDGPGQQHPMSARIDGVAWSAAAPLAAGPPTASGQVVAVSGASGAGTIAFAFQWFEGTTTYTIGNGPANANLYVGSDAWRAPAGGTVGNPDGTGGTITITALTDERIAGTFTFTLKAAQAGTTPEMRSVTDGVFDVRF